MKELHGLSITNLRYAIVYGPREWYGRVLTIFLKRALEGKDLIIFGDGKQIRDFVYVGDVVKMHNQCIINDLSIGQAFNVSTGVGTTINAPAATVLEVSGSHVDIIHEDVPEGACSEHFDRMRLPMELRRQVLSTKKAGELLGWGPSVALKEGIRHEYEWIQTHSHSWEEMSY